MTFNKYYQDELQYLHDLGVKFAEEHPALARFLSAGGRDPDVERLLEGFAFLTGRIRQKLDDELPEVTQALMSLLCPHFLHPLPAMSILQFAPTGHLTSKQTIRCGTTEVGSKAVDGTRCLFRTCYDVDIYPLSLERVEITRARTSSRLQLRFVLDEGLLLSAMDLDTLRLYLHGDAFMSQTLYLWLLKYLDTITVQSTEVPGRGQSFRPGIKGVGFDEHEGLLEYPPTSFVGYRLLQEYFALPQKFLFVELTNLAPLKGWEGMRRFDIICEFSRPLEDRIRLSTTNIRLCCTPIVNLFTWDAQPVRLEHNQVEYLVRPKGQKSAHYDIYTIDQVTGLQQGTGERRTYYPFLSRGQIWAEKGQHTAYYKMRREPAVIGRGVDTYISFVTWDEQPIPLSTETISLALTCTNSDLPDRLHAGDITEDTGSSPKNVTFQNIFHVTPSVFPPLDRGLYWSLISNMSLNYRSLMHVEALRALVSVYNFRAYYDQQEESAHRKRMQGMKSITADPSTKLLHGSPIRGLRIAIEVLESQFESEGEVYLFAAVLHEFFSLYSTINTFHELEIKNVERNTVYKFPAKIGKQQLL